MYLKHSYYQQYWQDRSLITKRLRPLMQTVEEQDVLAILDGRRLSVFDMPYLLSDAARSLLPQLAERAGQLTRQRFGSAVRMFAPLYVSNVCANDCSYCGFSSSNTVSRMILNMSQVEAECRALKGMGFDNVVLLTGEHEKKVGLDYFKSALEIAKPLLNRVLFEVQPLSSEAYSELREHGLDGVICYQESYNKEDYQKHHTRGKKTDFRWRLETADRAGMAQLDKIGLGILLGLSGWRNDALALGLHAAYLMKSYRKTQVSIAFPRLRPCVGGQTEVVLTSERDLLQLFCAFRLVFPAVELSLSTRERPEFRDNAPHFGVTHMSAGSVTEPGGYATDHQALEQFSIEDKRTPSQFAREIQSNDIQLVWRDWQPLVNRVD